MGREVVEVAEGGGLLDLDCSGGWVKRSIDERDGKGGSTGH